MFIDNEHHTDKLHRSEMFIEPRRFHIPSSVGAKCGGCRSYGARVIFYAQIYKHSAPLALKT